MSLLDELTTGPLAAELAPLIVAGDDGAVLAVLKDTSRYTRYGWITVADFNTWCAANNAEYQNIKAIAADSQNPFNAAAESLLRCLNGAVTDGAINLASQTVYGLVNSWPFVDQTGTAKSQLIALGTLPASRCDVLGINPTIQDIAQALRG